MKKQRNGLSKCKLTLPHSYLEVTKKKQTLQRIIISDESGQDFRICRFGLQKDKYDEDYIKFVFPNLINKKAFFQDIENNENIVIDENEKNSTVELSIHFFGGVSHFKFNSDERKFRRKSESTFENTPIIHLMDFIIYDLAHFTPFTEEIAPLDHKKMVFEKDKGKILEFYLSKYFDDRFIIPKSLCCSDIKPIDIHPFDHGDKKYRFIIIESNFIDPPKETGASVHRRNDPTIEFIEQTIPIDPIL